MAEPHTPSSVERTAPQSSEQRPPEPQPVHPIEPACRHEDDPSALRLVRAVSHEMRNPLNGILGMTHLLAGTSLDPAQRSYLDAIAASGDLLLRLVNDLLDLSALRAGSVALAPTPTMMETLVNQCLELAAPKAHAKGLGIGAMIDPRLLAAGTASSPDPALLVDGARLRQILTNLLSNAIKFTAQGGVRLSVMLDDGAESPGWPASQARLLLDVHDTGPGIDPADQALVFEPFGRGRSAGGTEGTGLGLPLSRGLAEAMGGRLDLVASKPDLGTHMRLTLPFEAVPFEPAGDGQEPQRVGPADVPLDGQSVLLVLGDGFAPADTNIDGDDLTRSPETDALVAAIEAFGATARIVRPSLDPTHGSAAELQAHANGADHVLVDARFDAGLLWARLALAHRSVPPVLLLRPDDRHLLADLGAAGFSGYLIRPVRQASLLAMLTHRFDAGTDAVGARPFLPDPADNRPPMRSDAAATHPQSDAPGGGQASRSQASGSHVSGSQTAGSQMAGAARHILLADDNPINTVLARAALTVAGHEVDTVADGEAALSAVTHASALGRPFEVVILDLTMPGLDGFETAKALRAGGYLGRLIAYSGNSDADLDERLCAAGFDGLARKPLQPDALQALVR